MSYESHKLLIQRLNDSFRHELNHPEFVGFRVLIDNQVGYVTVVYKENAKKNITHKPISLVKVENFASTLADLNISRIEAQVIYEAPARPFAARAGDPAWGDGLSGQGTLGWTIYLDGRLIAISNWHVFCAQGNATPLGTRCFAGENIEIGSLGYFDPVSMGGRNYWDFAYAVVTDPSYVLAEMRECNDGSRRPYPLRLGDQAHVAPGRRYNKVGTQEPNCRSGKFKGVGSCQVDYDGNTATFDNQIFFDRISDPGDSGSIVTEEQTNRVVGLHFAGSSEYSVSNPLFNKGWKASGTKLVDDMFFPMFESAEKRLINHGDTGPDAFNDANKLNFPDYSSSDLPSEITVGSSWVYAGPITGAHSALGINALGVQEVRLTSAAGNWMAVQVTFAKAPGLVTKIGWLHPTTGVVFLR